MTGVGARVFAPYPVAHRRDDGDAHVRIYASARLHFAS